MADQVNRFQRGDRKPIALVFAAVYWPGYKAGGPIRTLRNQVAALSREVDFRIVTADRDRGDPVGYSSVPLNRWTEVVGASVFYADAAHRRPDAMRRIVNSVNPDVVYINSFFDPVFGIQPILLRRLCRMAGDARWVVGPRGEFSAGALALKPWKKKPFVAVARLLGLHRDVIWQASSEFEAADIRRTMDVSAATIRVAPDPVDAVPSELSERRWHDPGTMLNVCFLSRITPKKNLSYAIEVLRQVRRPVRLNVYGPAADADYWAKCQKLAGQGNGIAVRYHGQVPHEQVRETLGQQDLFLLPTLGENFGHVIFEALAAGLPVLISDQTPWCDLEAAGVGWGRPLDDMAEFARIIESFADLPAMEKQAMARRAHGYAAQVAESSDVVRSNLELFKP